MDLLRNEDWNGANAPGNVDNPRLDKDLPSFVYQNPIAELDNRDSGSQAAFDFRSMFDATALSGGSGRIRFDSCSMQQTRDIPEQPEVAESADLYENGHAADDNADADNSTLVSRHHPPPSRLSSISAEDYQGTRPSILPMSPTRKRPQATNLHDHSRWPHLAKFCNQPSKHGRLILDCAGVLGYVEEVCEGSKALDQALRANKEAMRRIDSLLGIQKVQKSLSCSKIIAMAIRSMVKVLEESCLASGTCAKHPRGSCQGNVETDRAGEMGFQLPDIDFGVFSLDAEEQRLMRERIVCGELDRTLTEIQTLRSLCTRATTRVDYNDINSMRRSLDEVEERISRLKVNLKMTDV